MLKTGREVQPTSQKVMRVIGVQSGNAVDGIDVGVFDFEPVTTHKTHAHLLV